MCGCLPTELLDEFKAEGFRAFGIERTDIYVNKRPRINPTDFAAESVNIVISASDAYDCGSINERSDDFANFEVGWDEEKAIEFRDSGMCGNGVGEITRGRAGNSVKVEFFCFA